MEAQQDEQPPIDKLTPKTLAEEREFITPEESQDWFDSQDSQKAFQENNQQQQQVSHQTNTSNILKSVMSVQKSELSQNSVRQQTVQKKQEEYSKILEKQSKILANYKIFDERQPDLKPYYHKIDDRIAILLFKMQKYRLVDFLKIAKLTGKGAVELHCKANQLIVKTLDKETADQAINLLSDYIDDLNVLKLDIRPDLANKLQRCEKAKRQLYKRKIMVFNCDSSKDSRGLYIGGQLKPSQLKKVQLQIRNYKIFKIRMRMYRNRRSYKLVLGHIFESQFAGKEMIKLSGVNLIEVDNHTKESDIQVIMNIQTKVELSTLEYEDFITKLIKRFMVVCFIVEGHYHPKLAVPKQDQIKFIYVNERNAKYTKKSYLFIIAHIQTFFKSSEAIKEQLQKIGKFIIGVRFFNNLFPNFKSFIFEPELYYINKFPKRDTYSMIVTGRQREGKNYNWRATFSKFLEVNEADLSIFEPAPAKEQSK